MLPLLTGYFLNPLKSGVFGFALFFTFFIFIKLAVLKLMPQYHLNINSTDLLLSLIGFGFAFILRLNKYHEESL